MHLVLLGQLPKDGCPVVFLCVENQDRLKPADARKFFFKYLGKLNTSLIDTSISFAVNFNYQVYFLAPFTTVGWCACHEKPNPPSFSTPTFYSELGVEVNSATVTVIPEIPEHFFYLMQWLRIGGTNHLIFFERGANAYLVQGKMAVAAGF